MRKILGAIAMAGCVMTGANATTVYQFQVTSIECSGTYECMLDHWGKALNSLTISMTAPAGELHVKTDWYGPIYYQNSNISAVDFSAVDIFVNMQEKRCDDSLGPLCQMEASLQGGDSEYLRGNIWTNNTSYATVSMSTNGSDLWSGWLTSDFDMSGRPVYSGFWRAVPEPGTLILLGVGLAGLFGVRQRHRTIAAAASA